MMTNVRAATGVGHDVVQVVWVELTSRVQLVLHDPAEPMQREVIHARIDTLTLPHLV